MELVFNLDRITQKGKNNMKKIKEIMLGIFILTNINYGEVIKLYHPKGEPKGLYIATLHLGDSYYVEKKYRIYCPTSTVRDITKVKWGKARTVWEEDNIVFNGEGYLFEDFKEICKRK